MFSSLYAEVTEPEDALSVGDADGPDVALGPILEDVVDVAAVVDSDEEALGALDLNSNLEYCGTIGK